MRKLGVVTELASGPTEQFIKKLQSMNKEQGTTNEFGYGYVFESRRTRNTGFGRGVEPEIMQALARQMGGAISDLEIPVMTELNARQIYALAGLLCSIGDETDPKYDPIRSFAFWFMTLQISHKRRSRIEALEALKSIGQQPYFPMEQPGRIERFKRWLKGE